MIVAFTHAISVWLIKDESLRPIPAFFKHIERTKLLYFSSDDSRPWHEKVQIYVYETVNNIISFFMYKLEKYNEAERLNKK